MISENRHRLIVNINDLRRKKPRRAKAYVEHSLSLLFCLDIKFNFCFRFLLSMIENSFEELGCFQRALKEFVTAADATYAKNFDEFHVGFDGSFGAHHVSPRTLTSSLIGTMVCVEGIVTKCKLNAMILN